MSDSSEPGAEQKHDKEKPDKPALPDIRRIPRYVPSKPAFEEEAEDEGPAPASPGDD